MKNYSREWSKLTSDPHILDSVQNCHIEFWETPYQNIVPKPTIFNKNETEILDLEIKSLLDKGAIEETQHSEGQFISNIFLREKKNGKFRTIINLKDLNYLKGRNFGWKKIWRIWRFLPKTAKLNSRQI